MAENIYEIIKGNHPILMEKLDTNHELCTFLMLVYSHTLVEAASTSENPADLTLDVDVTNERLMRVTMRYVKSSALDNLRGVLDGKLFSKRNPSLVKLLDVNKNLKDLPMRVVTVLERWVNEKPFRKECGFANVRFENSIFWKNKIFTSEMVLKAEYDYSTIRAMGWDEPEQPTEGRIILP